MFLCILHIFFSIYPIHYTLFPTYSSVFLSLFSQLSPVFTDIYFIHCIHPFLIPFVSLSFFLFIHFIIYHYFLLRASKKALKTTTYCFQRLSYRSYSGSGTVNVHAGIDPFFYYLFDVMADRRHNIQRVWILSDSVQLRAKAVHIWTVNDRPYVHLIDPVPDRLSHGLSRDTGSSMQDERSIHCFINL